MNSNRPVSAMSFPLLAALAAATTPALAHPGPHYETGIAESLAHVALSGDHMAALGFAALCVAAAITARAVWTRRQMAHAKARTRSKRS